MFKGLRRRIRGIETLYESHDVQVIWDGDNIVIKPKNSRSSLSVQIGSRTYDLDSEMRFDRTLTEEKNLSILRHGKSQWSMGSNEVDHPLMLGLSREQIDQLQDIQLDGESIINRRIETLHVDNDWYLTVDSLMKDVPQKISVVFDGGYPDFVISDFTPDEDSVLLDLRDTVQKWVRISVPPQIEGELYVDGGRTPIDELNGSSFSMGSDTRLYVGVDNLQERISNWNNRGIEVLVLPDQMAPIKKSVETVRGEETVEFRSQEFEPLRTITVQYPDAGDVVNPRILYNNELREQIPKGILRSKYGEFERTNQDTYQNNMVIQSDNLKVSHSSGVGQFNENILRVENGTNEYTVELIPKRKTVRVENGDIAPVLISFDGESQHLGENETDTFESVRLSETVKITVEDNSGSTLDEREVERSELLGIQKIVISKNGEIQLL